MANIGNPQYITYEQAAAYAAQAGFSSQTVPGTKWTQIQVITAIAAAESGLDVHAYNPSDPNGGSYGILQINGFWFGHGITQSGALNPLQAFQFAYTAISHRGTNFRDWSTFTSGVYKNKIVDLPGQGNKPLSQLPSDGWWTFPRIDNLGQPDPFGGFPKPDSNIQLPDNYHIETILAGTVSSINGPGGKIDPWGASVTILLDQPLNSLADHIAYIHLSTVTVRVGQHVNVGDRIGYNGGNFAAGSQKVPLGVALYHGSSYGHDGWQYMTAANLTGNGKLNIVPLLDAAASGSLASFTPNFSQGNTAFSTVGNTQGLADFIAGVKQVTAQTAKLGPNPDLVTVLETLDLLMLVVNPFSTFINTDQANADAQSSGVAAGIGSIIGGGTAVGNGAQYIKDPNPLDWVGEFFWALSYDITALTIRGLFLFLGSYLCFRVVNQVVNITGTVERGGQVAANALRLAAAAG